MAATFQEDFDSFEVTEPLTRRIAGILQEYPDGTQIARELLQNSEDGRSTFQWYLLDHRDHGATLSADKLFHPDLKEYAGPALLAGNDSLFEKGDFVSLRSLADSGKKHNHDKIGQMGIGFNSVYHITDCPSFVSGGQFVVLEPEARVFNGRTTNFKGGVQGDFVKDKRGLRQFPAQLELFAGPTPVDMGQPYKGTMFRFPLRTKEQAKCSNLSKDEYSPQKAFEMLNKLKSEALKCLLFLKHVERIAIYEWKEGATEPTTLFDIEIVNAADVRKGRLKIVDGLKDHLDPSSANYKESELYCSVQPEFKLTHEDGTQTSERWHVSSWVRNAADTHDFMLENYDADIRTRRMIPWVGIAAPVDMDVKIENSRLFCFLPIGINTPFPVHINGHFAVKPSRREIWTNQDNDLSRKGNADIQSGWNVYMLQVLIPTIYARFLEDVGVTHGENYDLWPKPCQSAVGMDALWHDLLDRTLAVCCASDNKVFMSGRSGSKTMKTYGAVWIAGRDLDDFPLLLDALHGLTALVVDVPDMIVDRLPGIAQKNGLKNFMLNPENVRSILLEKKEAWSTTTSDATRIEMLKYCLEDKDYKGLEGLPLLPMADGSWHEFSAELKQTRFICPDYIFSVLKYSNHNIVNTMHEGIPELQYNSLKEFKDRYFTRITVDTVALKVKDSFKSHALNAEVASLECIPFPPDEKFPSREWISDFWIVANLQGANLVDQLSGLHLLPVHEGRLAPLNNNLRVITFREMTVLDSSEQESLLRVLYKQLGCNVMSTGAAVDFKAAAKFLVQLSDGRGVLAVMSTVSDELLMRLPQEDRVILRSYMSRFLSVELPAMFSHEAALRRLPIFEGYMDSTLKTLEEIGRPGIPLYICPAFQDMPWELISTSLLKEQQPMCPQLRTLLHIPTLTEVQYWQILLKSFNAYPVDQWDPIMARFFQMYHVYSKDYSFRDLIRLLVFVTVTGPSGTITGRDAPRRAPVLEVIDPELAPYYMKDEDSFPCGIYAQAPTFSVLGELGMTTQFNWAFVINRIEMIARRAHSTLLSEKNKVLEVASRFIRKLDSVFAPDWTLDGFSLLKIMHWIPARANDDSELGFYAAKDCRPSSDWVLIGDSMPLATTTLTNAYLLQSLGWDQPPPLINVLMHLVRLIEPFQAESSEDVVVNEDGFAAIYKDLQARISNATDVELIKKTLGSRRWILVNKRLHATDRVSLKLPCSLAPRFIELPSSKLDSLFLALGVRAKISAEDLQDIIVKIGQQYPGNDEPLSEDDGSLVVMLLNNIANMHGRVWSMELPVLTANSTLCKVADVTFNDMEDRSDAVLAEMDRLKYNFTHPKVSKDTAQKLKIQVLSARIWHDQKDTSFETWEQEEDIVDRIKHILGDYAPESIFTEFLQNAADAGATKISFILDRRNYGKHSLLSNTMGAWQGPALVIYNDAEFKEEDFRALCKLGIGSKGQDASKIGRYGLGFNSVYHFTDVPSVVSGSHIVFFDPQRTNLPKKQTAQGLVAKGGHRCDFLKLQLAKTFPDQVAPYKGLFGCDMESHFKGTIFRIPLRMIENDHVWTLKDLADQQERWMEEAKIAMLFLRRMKLIELRDTYADNYLLQWSVTKTDMTAHYARSVEAAREMSGFDAEMEAVQFSVKGHLGAHKGTSQDQKQKAPWTSKWIICRENKYTAATEQIKEIAEKHRLKPDRGVAFPLETPGKDEPKFEGRLFTHVPTPITTTLPFHIHGVLALLSNRQVILKGSKSGNSRVTWNQFMVRNWIPHLVLQALKVMFQICFPKQQDSEKSMATVAIRNMVEKYYRYWPKVPVPSSPKEMDDEICKWFWTRVLEFHIFPFRTAKNHFMPQSGTNLTFFDPGRFMDEALRTPIERLLLKNGTHVCDCPRIIVHRIESIAMEPIQARYLSAATLGSAMQKDPSFIADKTMSKESKEWIMSFIFQAILKSSNNDEDFSILADTSILPLVNGTWVSPIGSGCYFTANESARLVLSAPGELVDEELFKKEELEKILSLLKKDSRFRVAELSETAFTGMFLRHNPGKLSSSTCNNIWQYLAKETDLSVFGDLPILRSISGQYFKLSERLEGVRLTGLKPQMAEEVRALQVLFKKLHIPVYEDSQNMEHPALRKGGLTAVNEILDEIARKWAVMTIEYKFTDGQAAIVRKWFSSVKVLYLDLGDFEVWPAYKDTSLQESRSAEDFLVAAKGSYHISGDYSLDHLGDFPEVILADPKQKQVLQRLGSKPLTLPESALRFVFPALEAREEPLTETQIDLGYIPYMNLLFQNGLQNQYDVIRILLSKSVVLTEAKGFDCSQNLMDPTDVFLRQMYPNKPHKFVHLRLWQGLRRHRAQLRIKMSDQDAVVQECAEMVLRPIARHRDSDELPETVMQKVTTLIKFIYVHVDRMQINWMDEKWKIVPMELIKEAPQNEYLPTHVERFIGFNQAIDPKHKDFCWTQSGFFPESLIPSRAFQTKYPSVCQRRLSHVLAHLEMLIDTIAPDWQTIDQKLILKRSLFKIYQALENSMKHEATKNLVQVWVNNRKAPFILKGDDRDPSLAGSWIWPRKLMFDIETPTAHHEVVHPSLFPFRTFLVLSGVSEMKAVEGDVKVAPARAVGAMESMLLNCFESQDQAMGFMDIKFVFADGGGSGGQNRFILAHKFVLVHASDFFFRRLTGSWSEVTSGQDPDNLAVTLIDMTKTEDGLEEFWGLLYFMYTDQLLPTNGPPYVIESESSQGDGTTSDAMSDRIQYLMRLQLLAGPYELDRLQDLIAEEIISNRMVAFMNVYDIKAHAQLAHAQQLVEFCETYIRINKGSLWDHVQGELVLKQREVREVEMLIEAAAEERWKRKLERREARRLAREKEDGEEAARLAVVVEATNLDFVEDEAAEGTVEGTTEAGFKTGDEAQSQDGDVIGQIAEGEGVDAAGSATDEDDESNWEDVAEGYQHVLEEVEERKEEEDDDLVLLSSEDQRHMKECNDLLRELRAEIKELEGYKAELREFGADPTA